MGSVARVGGCWLHFAVQRFAYRIRNPTTTTKTAAVTLSAASAAVFVRFLGHRGDAVAAVLFQYTLTRGQTVETGQAI